MATLRLPLSLASIAIGLLMLVWVGVRQIDNVSFSSGNGDVAIAPLTKGSPQDCLPDWRFVDNPAQRFTLCVPLNMVAFDSSGIVLLEQAAPEQLSRLYGDFILANNAWLAPELPFDPAHPALPPVHLRIEVVPPTRNFDGCKLRDARPDADGIVTCEDRYFMDGMRPFFVPDAPQGSRAHAARQDGKRGVQPLPDHRQPERVLGRAVADVRCDRREPEAVLTVLPCTSG
jgi:hypothetical protein